jgi:hypothetical protein
VLLLLLVLVLGLQQSHLLLVRLHCRQQELHRQRLQRAQAGQAKAVHISPNQPVIRLVQNASVCSPTPTACDHLHGLDEVTGYATLLPIPY